MTKNSPRDNLSQNLCAVKPKETWFPLAIYNCLILSVYLGITSY